MSVDVLLMGAPYEIGRALFEALETAPELAGAKFLNNPVRISDLSDGARVVFFEDVSDEPDTLEKARRVYAFTVGVISRSDNPRAGAHADYRAVKRVLGNSMPVLLSIATVNSMRENAVTFRVENVDVGGGLVLGAFTVGYRDKGLAA